MPLSKRAPRPALTGLASLQREIDQLFGRLGPEGRAEEPAAGEWSPSTDVFESRGQIVVTVEVPGLTPENLRIAYKHHRLIITGERRERRPADASAAFLCMERPQGRFSRQIPLDQAVDIPRAEARLAGGVLTILIPRLKDRRGRETLIPIKWEEGRDPQ
jgi:HSP20 family protein